MFGLPSMNRFDQAQQHFWRTLEEAADQAAVEKTTQRAAARSATPGNASPANVAEEREPRTNPSTNATSANAAADGSTPSIGIDWPQFNRRRFLKLTAASMAIAGCSRRPLEPIVPYHDGPAASSYGAPIFFATTLENRGYGLGVLVENNMGRPTKVEGNLKHPASLGSTDVFAQAAVRDLWDPDRSQLVLQGSTISTWDAFLGALMPSINRHSTQHGEGLALLFDANTSPTTAHQLAALRERFPRMAVYMHDALSRENVYAGSAQAFGRRAEPVYRFDKASAIVSLDANFLGDMPGHVRYARDHISTRRITDDVAPRARLWAVESTPRLSGAMADERIAASPAQIEQIAWALALRLKAPVVMPQGGVALTAAQQRWVDAAAHDLQSQHEAALVVVGDEQTPIVHALAHAMNVALHSFGHTLTLIEPVLMQSDAGLAQLVDAARDGAIESLFILGANPVYQAPAYNDIAAALKRIPFTAHLGRYADETAAFCNWHIPAAHALESWGDARAFDGSASLVQPLIAPLYDGRSINEVLAVLGGVLNPQPRELVRTTWQRDKGPGDFEAWWDESLRSGVIADSAFKPLDVRLREPIRREHPINAPADDALTLVFRADASVGDGRYANNPWLQELPRPISALCWDNAIAVSPALAARMGLKNEDVIEVRAGDALLSGPVWLTPGQADSVITLPLGYGRTRVGQVGNNVGFNAYVLRHAGADWSIDNVVVHPLGRTHALASVQAHHRMQGRDIVRYLSATQAQQQLERGKQKIEQATLYPPYPQAEHQWAMSINLSSCIGCNACTIACQAENNIPTVGKREVMRGREMHWIRVDTYFAGPVEAPNTLFQPVPCMHCEHAPCEYVCPVEASVHNMEGLNVQVYNRCVGTRFCSNNCPYKVRRFNFFQYAEDKPSLNAQRNPEVTVRMRGVMEKCNYCLQRIRNAEIIADRDNRKLVDGDVVTACQAVCPTQAIVFGDLRLADSAVNRAKASALDYAMLGELNTRPRTTYLARVANPAKKGDST
jgi:molybdopterin-containing oxidoreductase family iron-sulfur binding subunit